MSGWATGYEERRGEMCAVRVGKLRRNHRGSDCCRGECRRLADAYDFMETRPGTC